MVNERKTMRPRVIKALNRKRLDAHAVENPAGPGTPDVNFIEGWIELKQLEDWPARAETVVHFDHFTPQQRVWLLRRWLSGGNAWMLIKVADEWLLLDGKTAAEIVGKVTRSELMRACKCFWMSGASMDESLAAFVTLPR